jgi:hypothetical protein
MERSVVGLQSQSDSRLDGWAMLTCLPGYVADECTESPADGVET